MSQRDLTIIALHLKPGQIVREYRKLGAEDVEFERQVRRVHTDNEDGLVFVEFEETSYEGETSCYEATTELDIVV